MSTNLNTHLHLLLRLGLYGVLPLFSIYTFMACTGAPLTLLPPSHSTYPFHSFLFVQPLQQY